MTQRFDLDEAVNQSRKPIDANWSSRKKTVVASGCALVAILAIGGGAWVALAQRPPALPTTADEALQIMRTGAFDRLDDERKRQYAAEARRLLGGLSPEERRALLDGENDRELLWDLRQQIMEDMARRIARGEEVEWPPREGASDEQRRQMRERFENMSEEERAEFRREAIARVRDNLAESAESGNGQSSALVSEMRRSRGGAAGGRRRGGR